MTYLWNIANWCIDILPAPLRLFKFIAFTRVQIEPIRLLHQEFLIFRLEMIRKIRVNGQTVVMENILNNLFDPTNRGIEITTSYDTIDPVFIGQPSEFATNPTFFAQPSENAQVFIGQPSEYGVLHDFVVKVPATILTSAQEVQLKSLVKRYKYLSTKPYYIYNNGIPF